jgi:DNA adenine methylase
MSYTVSELKKLCKEKNIKGYSTKKKDELLQLLGLKDESNNVENLTELFEKQTLEDKTLEKVKSSGTTKPFLKWVGGKTQILDDVLSRFPKTMNNYHETFLGGGSVLLGLLSYQKQKRITIHQKIYASDINLNLISLYKNIQTNIEEFITELSRLKEEYESKLDSDSKTPESKEEFYYQKREEFNQDFKKSKESNRSSVLFLFLNKTCFRGVYREGPKGFNVPFGHNKNVSIFDETHLREVSELIQPVIFTHQSFEKSLEICQEHDFVYLDPPYAPENDKSFVGYVKDGFTLEQHNLLFTTLKSKEIKFGGIKFGEIKFLMSNADVALVKDVFPEPYKTTIVECRRAINSKNPGAKTNEVLIQNF